MTIGIDASRANAEQKTGVEAYAFYLIQALKKSIPADVRVILYSREPLTGELAELPKNWQSKVLHWPPKKFWTQIRLSIEMLIHAPDVLFIPAHVFPFIHPEKTVMTVHDVAAIRFPNTYTRFERWYSVYTAKCAVETLWRVIVPSLFARDELVSLCRHSSRHTFQPVSSEPQLHRSITVVSDEVKKILSHVRVVAHGYDSATFHLHLKGEDKEIARIKKIYGITKPYLLTVGRLEEKKNTWRIIKAFDQLRKTSALDVQLVLAGKPGVGHRKVVTAIQESEFRTDIIKTGWVEESHIPYLLAGAELFVFPSLYEGFGLPVLEAMGVGIPVIASRENSLEEVGGHAAMYVDAFHVDELAKKMNHVLKSKEVQEKMITAGRTQAARFSWKRCAEETTRILLNR